MIGEIMKFTISKDIATNDTIYILTIREADLIKMRHTRKEIEHLDKLGKSNEISDKLLGLKIITNSIEKEE